MTCIQMVVKKLFSGSTRMDWTWEWEMNTSKRIPLRECTSNMKGSRASTWQKSGHWGKKSSCWLLFHRITHWHVPSGIQLDDIVLHSRVHLDIYSGICRSIPDGLWYRRWPIHRTFLRWRQSQKDRRIGYGATDLDGWRQFTQVIKVHGCDGGGVRSMCGPPSEGMSLGGRMTRE